MKIKIILTKGDPITVTEEQAQAILSSPDPLIALKDETGSWNGDVIHRSHIVQMVRDLEAEKNDLLANPRIQSPQKKELDREEMHKLLTKNRPKFLYDTKR